MKTKMKILESKRLDRNVYMTPDDFLEKAFEEFASDVDVIKTHVSAVDNKLIVTVIYQEDD